MTETTRMSWDVGMFRQFVDPPNQKLLVLAFKKYLTSLVYERSVSSCQSKLYNCSS